MNRPRTTNASIIQATAEVVAWFSSLNRKPFAFQRRAWREYLSGRSGLIHSHTGTGKTLAALLGPVIEELAINRASEPSPAGTHTIVGRSTQRGVSPSGSRGTHTKDVGTHTDGEGVDGEAVSPRAKKVRGKARKNRQLKVLWITPLRALASDTETTIRSALEALKVDWLVEKRTSDTPGAMRAKQSVALPEVLITTPESATVQLSRTDCAQRFSQLRLILVDEWHELLGTKRGVQTELVLARIKALAPGVQVWGLSATLGNLEEALATLTGPVKQGQATLIAGKLDKKIRIEELIPENMERFPWAGHLGNRLAAQVAERIRASKTALVFTNTRSQAEIWYRALLAEMPELAGLMAVHHGSLDQKLRWWIEDRLRDGRMRCCVCTSSLELGVDFPEVDRVVQIGSPKGCSRLIQRAGRSGHRPAQVSQITFVPTHALELVEIAALKQAVAEGHIEQRVPLNKPLDVLAQHVVTVALGSGFKADALLAEVRTTRAYRDLEDHEWQWVLDFATRGGSSLAAYPDYHRIELVGDVYTMTNRRLAALHRMSIGTIVSDASIQVRYLTGKTLGTIEEAFVSKLSPGDRFMLAGKLLELVRIHDNTAWVKRGKGTQTAIPRWMGGRMPLSSELSQALRDQLEMSIAGIYKGPAMKAVRPMLQLQLDWSTLPAHDELLIERWHDREGHYVFVYPFEGRLVHEGLAALWALRLSRVKPLSFSMAMNDYGFLLVCKTEPPVSSSLSALLAIDDVGADILSSLNASEMCRRQFREIARIAGLLFQGFPGQKKLARQLQASSNLFYDVFCQYDPDNLLLKQARREVLERQLEESRLLAAMKRMSSSRVLIRQLDRPTPLAFPLIADRLRDRLSSESFAQRIERMLQSLTAQAEGQSQAESGTG